MFWCIFQEKIGSWFSNPGTGADIEASGGGVGKYLKARSGKVESTTAVDDGGGQAGPTVVKKRKLGVSTQELKDFSGW